MRQVRILIFEEDDQVSFEKACAKDDVVGEKNTTAEHFRRSSFRHRSFKMYLLIRSASTRTRKAQGLVPGKSETMYVMYNTMYLLVYFLADCWSTSSVLIHISDVLDVL